MELLAGSFAGKEFIPILIFCCDATDNVISKEIKNEVVCLNINQSKSFLMRYAEFHAKNTNETNAAPLYRLLIFAKISTLGSHILNN